MSDAAPAAVPADAPAATPAPEAAPAAPEALPAATTPASEPLSSSGSGSVSNSDSTAPTLASIQSGGREVSPNIIHVSNIHSSVEEQSLQDLFNSIGHEYKSLKILQDKNNIGFNYAFVEYENEKSADDVLTSLNGTQLANNQIKISKAYQTQQVKNSDTFNLFIGDLSLEINDESLNKAFSNFSSLVQANVMWDMKTGRSRGYGFVCFANKSDAEDALKLMNGATLGDRQIRLNWASHRDRTPRHHNNQNHNHNHRHQIYQQQQQQPRINTFGNINHPLHTAGQFDQQQNVDNMLNLINNSNIQPHDHSNNNFYRGANKYQQQSVIQPQSQNMPPLSYEMVLRQTPNWQTVVYLGNLSEYTTQNDLIPLLQNFGYIVNFKLLQEKNCAFVTYDTHQRAALAIVQLSGFAINGRPLRSGWGKSSNSNSNLNNQNSIANGNLNDLTPRSPQHVRSMAYQGSMRN